MIDNTEEETLAALLQHHMNDADYGTTTLCQAVNAKFESCIISRSTLTSWRDGKVDTIRDSSWKNLASVLHVLGLDKQEADKFFRAAGLKSLEEHWHIYSEEEETRKIFQPWIPTIEKLSQEESELLSVLKPLTSEQRHQIEQSRAVSLVGISLSRLFAAFQYEFRQMLSNGGVIRTVLSHPEGAAMEMAELRSESQTPKAIQKERVNATLKLLALWKSNMPKAKIQVRLLDYLPPYGITIIHPFGELTTAKCLVRLYAFRSSTSKAPTIDLDPNESPQWIEFFCEQFEKLWEAGQIYSLTG